MQKSPCKTQAVEGTPMSLHYEKEFHIVAVTLSDDTGCLLIPKLDKGNSAVVGAERLGCIWERSKSLED